MSVIWAISRDVLSATWSMPAKRLMGIAFRLSVVAGVVMTGVALVDQYLSYKRQFDSELNESIRIWTGLNCARAFTDEELLRHVNQFGLFDISKVGCSNKRFLAHLKEVRSVTEAKIPDLDYRRYVNPLAASVTGVIWMVIVTALGGMLILVRGIAAWVIGTERT